MNRLFIFALLVLSLSSPHFVSAEMVAIQLHKSWGPGKLLATTNKNDLFKYQTDGKGNPAFFFSPIHFKYNDKMNIMFDIKIDKMSSFSGFEIRLGDEGFENYYGFSIPNFSDPEFNILQDHYWHHYSFGLSNATVVGEPRNKIKRFGLYVQDNGKGPFHVSLRNLTFKAPPEHGYVSITFDDGYKDNYIAAQIMNKYDFPGTAYVMPRQIGKPGYMSLSQVKELNTKYHWGISSHHAIPYTDFSPEALVDEIRYTINFLTRLDFPLTARHLAYPLGKQNRATVLPIVRRFFDTARVAGGGIETLPPADPHLLRTFNVLNITRPEDLIKIVKNAVNNGQWAILMFHYLVDEPRIPIEYRTTDFVKFIDLLSEAKVTVLPVSEVYRKSKHERRESQ